MSPSFQRNVPVIFPTSPSHLPLAPTLAALLSLAPVTDLFAQQAPDADTAGTLKTIEIQERSEGAASGYAGPRGGTAATRTETPLIEVPQAVRRIGAIGTMGVRLSFTAIIYKRWR